MEDIDKNMYSEAILGMLSEMSKKLDVIQASSKAKEIQSINQKINPTLSKKRNNIYSREASRIHLPGPRFHPLENTRWQSGRDVPCNGKSQVSEWCWDSTRLSNSIST
ncbi:hypothetical protein AGMMS49574_18220 [Bacteroidia bacterium]|nr:hypothetical protein AGMMS49574_18220 [Bacteroidia bacterium]